MACRRNRGWIPSAVWLERSVTTRRGEEATMNRFYIGGSRSKAQRKGKRQTDQCSEDRIALRAGRARPIVLFQHRRHLRVLSLFSFNSPKRIETRREPTHPKLRLPKLWPKTLKPGVGT